MNRTALNGGVIGSGASLPWASGAGQQLFRLSSAVSVGLTKYGKAAGSLTLTGALAAGTRLTAVVAQLFTATGAIANSVWKLRRTRLSGALSLYAIGSGFLNKRGKANQTSSLSGALTPTIWRVIHSDPMPVNMNMMWYARGVDAYTGPAPEDRTVGIIDLTTAPRTAGAVSLGA